MLLNKLKKDGILKNSKFMGLVREEASYTIPYKAFQERIWIPSQIVSKLNEKIYSRSF